jgi:hypothetical protein
MRLLGSTTGLARAIESGSAALQKGHELSSKRTWREQAGHGTNEGMADLQALPV